MGCNAPIDATVGTPLGGTTLLHMCVEYDELEIARWLLDQGMDVNVRARVGANGFGGYTALFSTVVSQPNFWMNYSKRGPFVAPMTELPLERGADPNVRASIVVGAAIPRADLREPARLAAHRGGRRDRVTISRFAAFG